MQSKTFCEMRKRLLREHKRSIVRSGLNGRRRKGRGVVMVTVATTGKPRISYLALDALTRMESGADPQDRRFRAMLIERLSSYSLDTEMPVVVTDGESRRYSLGVRQA